jgi:hypothetical protein
MTKTAFFLALVIAALSNMPADAQVVRAFVSGHGSDTNPCTLTQPCRTYQRAHDSVPANAYIEALDPAGYQPVVITKGISIQGHGYSSIFQNASCGTCAAITVSVTTGEPVTLNGLLLDGVGTGSLGIYITSGPSVHILNSYVHHFQFGIYDQTTTSGSKLLIEDTVASDNSQYGFIVAPSSGTVKATLNRITANNNSTGVGNTSNTTIANSVLSNNTTAGLEADNPGTVRLAKTVISGSPIGVTGFFLSYGDNYLDDNTTPFAPGVSNIATQ